MSDASVISAAPVVFETRPAAGGRAIGIATLNAPKTLNGLSLEMARLLDAQLREWADDARIAVVVLQGAGEKAFCAGGDLHSLYRGMVEFRDAAATDVRDNAYAREFFAVEYRLDYRIHTFPKPLLCWGHGIVMGGGIGLMAGASHRVVSERSKLAFPEITVGLYPDVGGSWLLNRVPRNGGLFLALTGAPLNAGDAVYAGLADHFIAEACRADVVDALGAQVWTSQAATDRAQLSALLQTFAQTPVAGPLQQHAAVIEAACAAQSLEAVAAAIRALAPEDAWLQGAQAALAAGAPSSARLGFELQRRAAVLTLADTFRLEYGVSLHCAAHGIRALLIDKDRTPRWQPATLAEASAAWAARFFVSPWPDAAHPLADLGASVVEESA
jgi:enoyl-CoA hydratase/carnithine racemase